MEPPENIPESGAIFTFGSSKLTGNTASCFWLKNDIIVSASCGDEHTALVTEKGKVYVFGSNNWGQLGLGHTHPSKKPACIKTLKHHKASMVACGRTHTLVCTSDNQIFAFGNNSDSQLGIDSLSNSNTPVEVKLMNIGKIKQIAAGADFSVLLTDDGSVYTWGSNAEGQIGLGSDINESESPTKIEKLEQIEHLACGYYHTALVSRSGNVYTFGEDEFDKLGKREMKNMSIPSKLILPESVKVSKVACGGSHTAFITRSGDLYTLGGGSHGELGHGTTILQSSEPKLVERLKGHGVTHVSCGENFTSAVSNKGRLYTFGDGRHGKLAVDEENFVNQFKPFRCNRFSDYDVKFAVCGGCHMVVSATSRGNEDHDSDSEIEDPMQSYADAQLSKGDSQIPNAKMNGNNDLAPTEGSMDLSRSLSAREKRRQGRENTLSRTLPPLRTMKANELAAMAKTLPKPVPSHRSTSTDWINPKSEKNPVKKQDEVSEISDFNKVHKLVKVGNIDTLIAVEKLTKQEKNNERDGGSEDTGIDDDDVSVEEEVDDDEAEDDDEEEEEEDEDVEDGSTQEITQVEDISDRKEKPGSSKQPKTDATNGSENKETPQNDAQLEAKTKMQDEHSKSGDKPRSQDLKGVENKEVDKGAPQKEKVKEEKPDASGENMDSQLTPDAKEVESEDATTRAENQTTSQKKGTKKSKLCNIL